jgi:hypothetical protein
MPVQSSRSSAMPEVRCLDFAVALHTVFSARGSVLEAQCSRLSARGSVLEAQCSRLSARGSVLEAQCSRLRVQCSGCFEELEFLQFPIALINNLGPQRHAQNIWYFRLERCEQRETTTGGARVRTVLGLQRCERIEDIAPAGKQGFQRCFVLRTRCKSLQSGRQIIVLARLEQRIDGQRGLAGEFAQADAKSSATVQQQQGRDQRGNPKESFHGVRLIGKLVR